MSSGVFPHERCQVPFRAWGHRTGIAVERLVHNSFTDFPCANKLSDCVMIDSFNLASPQAHPPSLWHGRRGTCSQQPSFCLAGVALMALGWLWWRAWSPLVGVALGDMDVAFAWQAWPLMALGWLWSPVEALASFSCASLYAIFITHNSSHTTCLTSRSSTTSFVFPSFPVPLQLLLLIIGRSWLVGLSGPLMYLTLPLSDSEMTCCNSTFSVPRPTHQTSPTLQKKKNFRLWKNVFSHAPCGMKWNEPFVKSDCFCTALVGWTERLQFPFVAPSFLWNDPLWDEIVLCKKKKIRIWKIGFFFAHACTASSPLKIHI